MLAFAQRSRALIYTSTFLKRTASCQQVNILESQNLDHLVPQDIASILRAVEAQTADSFKIVGIPELDFPVTRRTLDTLSQSVRAALGTAE